VRTSNRTPCNKCVLNRCAQCSTEPPLCLEGGPGFHTTYTCCSTVTWERIGISIRKIYGWTWQSQG
jgi:hypothetical protein